jgi:MoxR-like ATPase
VFLPEAVARHAARLVEASSPTSTSCPADLRRRVRFGASPRAAIALAEAGRASALLAGRPNVDFSDVERVAVPALAHRLVLDHVARLEGVTAADLVRRLIAAVDPVAGALPKEMR